MSMKIQGLDVLQKQLSQMEAKLARKVLRTAARKAFKPVLDAAVAGAPRDTGLLSESIRMKVVLPKSGDPVVAVGLIVIARKGGRQKDLNGFKYGSAIRAAAWRRSAHWRWHFAEKGTKKMAATPFLRPALINNQDAVLNGLRIELDKAIKATLKKAGKKKQ